MMSYELVMRYLKVRRIEMYVILAKMFVIGHAMVGFIAISIFYRHVEKGFIRNCIMYGFFDFQGGLS